MEIVQDLHLQTSEDRNTRVTQQLPKQQHAKLRDYKWWIRVCLYIMFYMVGQSTATLLGRLYFDKGCNSKWMVAFVQSAGFPVLLPLFCNFTPHSNFAQSTTKNLRTDPTKPKFYTLIALYLAFGLLIAADNLMYSYGLLYLPLSTFALLGSTQLAFNALFTFFLNSQKFTALIFNSIVLLTMSASLLALNSESDADSTDLPKDKHVLGFLLTIGASATFSLYVSLVQLSFDKLIKSETFSAVLNMQFYPASFSTCVCVVGLFASGEWNTLNKEMKEYQKGRVSYIMTLLWTAVSWQISSIGMLGLVFEVSSLFANVIGAMVLPVVPILAVIFFHDKINGVKFIALMLAIWGFLSYIYQHYIDDRKAKAKTSQCPQVSKGEVEIC